MRARIPASNGAWRARGGGGCVVLGCLARDAGGAACAQVYGASGAAVVAHAQEFVGFVDVVDLTMFMRKVPACSHGLVGRT